MFVIIVWGNWSYTREKCMGEGHSSNYWRLNCAWFTRKENGRNVKVRGFSGANINDFYTYLIPLLRKKPSYIILMVGTNDAMMKSSEELLAELLALKNWILEVLPGVIITMSCPTIRNDNQKARLTILNLRKKLNDLKLSTIINDNIVENHLGRKRLHLNNRGSARLAMNYLAHIRRH